MTRVRASVQAGGNDAEVWQQLARVATLWSRLAPEMAPGSSVQIADRWRELSSSARLTPAARIEALIATCIDLGAPAGRVRELVQHARDSAAEPGAADRRRDSARHSAERRARLELPKPWRIPDP